MPIRCVCPDRHPNIHAECFKGSRGHDVARLATQLSLDDFLKLYGTRLRDDLVWKRLTSSKRPYSLRYGTEVVTPALAAEEVDRVQEVSEPLLADLRRYKNAAKKGKKSSKPLPAGLTR